ncbi:MAG TPA: response regulator [Phycisphaerae bacterium]|nr:response regulator [Phycisphaerae bacterium]
MNPKKILIIEDDPKSRYALQSILEDHGHHVRVFDNAEDASKLDGTPFDAAIIDIRLPQQSGAEFARQFRKEHSATRIVFVTAYDGLSSEMLLEGTVLLVKPIDVDALLKLI